MKAKFWGGRSIRQLQKIKVGDKDREVEMQDLNFKRRIWDAEVTYLNWGSGRLIWEGKWEDMQLAFDLWWQRGNFQIWIFRGRISTKSTNSWTIIMSCSFQIFVQKAFSGSELSSLLLKSRCTNNNERFQMHITKISRAGSAKCKSKFRSQFSWSLPQLSATNNIQKGGGQLKSFTFHGFWSFLWMESGVVGLSLQACD